MNDSLGWRGKTVRNLDGRTGIIRRETTDFMGATLTIAVDGGTEAQVQLNANMRDSGDKGWSWHCPEFADGPAWLPLGDHNTHHFQRDNEAGVTAEGVTA